MAVIKIVPMPGAVGDKGDEGAVGPQGQQGPAGQNGLPGTPALWSYQGAYNPAAAYAVGDVVIYQGQLYYTKSVTTAGTLPTVTAKFDLIASKGADGTNGTNGADGATPFTLIGAYDNGASYNLGIAVYYNGGTYVRTGNPLNPGYPPTLGAINESWTPIAEKGSDGGLTYWDGTGDPGTPTNPGIAILTGIATPLGGGLLLSASDKITINANNGEFINDATVPANQIATIGDLTTPISGTWDTKFAFHSGIDLSVENTAYESNKMGYYYCVGDLVHWEFRMLMGNPVSWGSAGTWAFELPFPPYFANDSVTGSPIKNAYNRTIANGWFRVLADVDPTPEYGLITAENTWGNDESHFLNANVILRTYARTETGNYINSVPGYPYPATWPTSADLIGMAFLIAPNQDAETPENTKTIGYKSINSTWPANLVQALADNNDGIPANNASEFTPQGRNENVIQFNFSGVYRKA